MNRRDFSKLALTSCTFASGVATGEVLDASAPAPDMTISDIQKMQCIFDEEAVPQLEVIATGDDAIVGICECNGRLFVSTAHSLMEVKL